MIWRTSRRPGRKPGDEAPEFGDRIAAVHLLDLALDPGLRRIFDERIDAKQDVPVEFRLAAAVSPDRVDVNPRANHVVCQDRGELFVCGRSGDDLSALDGVFSRGSSHEIERASEIAQRLVCCAPVDVVEAD
jgi:hypothetical protein